VVAPVTARELGLEELQASGHTSERLAELFSIERAVLFRPQARGSRSKPQPERSADDPSEATQP
jgi:hypothetical protein